MGTDRISSFALYRDSSKWEIWSFKGEYLAPQYEGLLPTKLVNQSCSKRLASRDDLEVLFRFGGIKFPGGFSKATSWVLEGWAETCPPGHVITITPSGDRIFPSLRSLIGGSKVSRVRERLIAERKNELEIYASQVLEYASQNFSDRSISRLAENICQCLNAKGVSLWIYTRKTRTYTLGAAIGDHKNCYQKDWVHESTQCAITYPEPDNGGSSETFKPPLGDSPNPDVASLYEVAFRITLRGPVDNHKLGALIVYSDESQFQPDQIVESVAAITESHLEQIRIRRQRVGVELVDAILNLPSKTTLQQKYLAAAISVCENMKVGACSVFAKSLDGKGVELIASAKAFFSNGSFAAEEVVPNTPVFYKSGQGMTGGIFKNMKPRIEYDIKLCEVENSHLYDEPVGEERKGWIGMPIRSGDDDQPVGVLRAINKIAIDPSGTIRTVHFQQSDLDALKHLATVLAYLWKDDHAKKEQASLLKQAERDRDEKEQFISSLTHEILAPLQPLRATITLLQNFFKKRNLPDSERAQYLLETADCECSQMEMIFGNVAVSNDTQPLPPAESVPIVEEIIHPVLNMMRLQAQVDKDVKFYFDEDMWKLPEVFVPSSIARQIFFVLAHNAVKYCDVDTTIMIGGIYSKEYRAVGITVENRGIDIPSGWEERIFERGERAPNVRDQLFPGSGLGLHIARSLARRLKGDIVVDSRKSPVRLLLILPEVLS